MKIKDNSITLLNLLDMKKLALSANILALSLAAVMATSCGNNSANGSAQNAAPAASQTTDGTAPALNIRYVDHDSIMAQYNLAKDFQEAYVRALSKVDNARQAKGAELQKFAATIEQKARSNGYLSEASYNADMATLQKKQQEAETYLANLSRNTENELAQQQLQLNDSIEKFIKEYNATRGYDAILFKAAGIYFNPALDVTAEVVAGLNARYNKVDESK